MDTHIELTSTEMFIGAQVGVIRQVQNLQKKRVHLVKGLEGAGWQSHVEGALGEQAVAKWKGMYWSGNIGNIHTADVGNLQVRTTDQPTNKLIIRPKDNDNDIFILVIGKNGVYDIVGWIRGISGKNNAYLYDPHGKGKPAWFVPQNSLHGMSELPTTMLERED